MSVNVDKLYIGTLPCGCVTFAYIDGPRRAPGETQKALAEAISEGHEITRSTVEEARSKLSSCTHQSTRVRASVARMKARTIMQQGRPA